MEKFKDKRKIMKAYLITCGYEEDLHNLKTDSPTCSHETMCFVMITKWQVESLDFISIFLQDGKLKRETFLKLPTDIYPES